MKTTIVSLLLLAAFAVPTESVEVAPGYYRGKYTVRFLANGGTGTMKKQAFSYGTAKKLRANAFERPGYEFVGWAKSKAKAEKGKVAYKDQKSVKNLTRAGGTVKLYAVWRKL